MVPSRASSALSAAVCGSVPATTTTLSGRISVWGKAGFHGIVLGDLIGPGTSFGPSSYSRILVIGRP